MGWMGVRYPEGWVWTDENYARNARIPYLNVNKDQELELMSFPLSLFRKLCLEKIQLEATVYSYYFFVLARKYSVSLVTEKDYLST